MGPKSKGVGRRVDKLSHQEHQDWFAIQDLLQQANYEGAADQFQHILTNFEPTKNPMLATLLAVAQQLCMTCSQYRSEVSRHQEAYAEAVVREKEMRRQLTAVLDQVKHLLEPNSDFIDEPVQTEREELAVQTGEGRRLWRGARAIFGRGSFKDKQLPPLSYPPYQAGERTTGTASENGPQKDRPITFTVYCFGTFRVYMDGRLIENWNGNKSKAIFKYLLFHSEPTHSEILMDIFWRDIEPAASRRNLYQAIYVLRQALQAKIDDQQLILCSDGTYQLNPNVNVWLDCRAFRQHYELGRKLIEAGKPEEAIREFEAADNLYGGEFIPEDRYEDWVTTLREDLRHSHLEIIDWLSQEYFNRQQYTVAISYARKILQVDNCREDAHRRLMRAYHHLGQRHLALRQYHLCVSALREVLDVDPMPATIELSRLI